MHYLVTHLHALGHSCNIRYMPAPFQPILVLITVCVILGKRGVSNVQFILDCIMMLPDAICTVVAQPVCKTNYNIFL